MMLFLYEGPSAYVTSRLPECPHGCLPSRRYINFSAKMGGLPTCLPSWKSGWLGGVSVQSRVRVASICLAGVQLASWESV